MNLREDDENLNFRYKDLTEEEKLVDTLVNECNEETEFNSSNNNRKITKDEIMKSVKEQIKKTRRTDMSEEQNNEWFEEYQKQPITINKDRVRDYLNSYEDLEKLIEFRKDKLIKGEVEPESKTLEINKLPDLEFLKSSNINKEEFYSKVDYKLREMKFYKSTLSVLLNNLKTYGLLIYQYIAFKYFLKLDSKDIESLTPFKNLDYLDNLAINYLTNKLVEEFRKEE
ncbi:MAG: hypothetical protein IJX34_01025 [Clostridia bacterium]|nr:hypothetical protein [Clostridia bacterium]